jgi:predicted O-methyltransferase YrrM
MIKYLNLKKYKDKIEDIYFKLNYNLDEIRQIELKKFNDNNLLYEKSLIRLNDLLQEKGKKSFNADLESIHWLLFSCLAEDKKISNILELGTFDGETTSILADLFPSANITTIDLPYNDPIFSTTYSREDEINRKNFIDRQQKNIASDRIKFIQKNSFFLLDVVNEKFDLIWVDAGHLYPEVAWDICNAYYLCKSGGYIMFDDVIPNQKGLRNGYVSPDSYSVLEYMRKRSNDSITYFFKRESPRWSANPKRRKYVAFMQKK